MSEGSQSEEQPQAAPIVEAGPSPTEVLVSTWFNTHVANSPVSQSAEAINHMTQIAIPALVKLLSTKG